MSSELTRQLHQAIDLSDAEKWPEAIDLFTSILEKDPALSQAYFERGMVWLNLEQANRALQDFEKVLELDPEYPGGRDWYASTLDDLQDHAKAGDTKLTALRLLPDGKYGMGVSPQGWADCAGYFYKAGLKEKALEVLLEYFADYQAKVKDYVVYETAPLRLAARIYLEKGDPAQAQTYNLQAMESSHHNPADQEMNIEILIRLNQKETAQTLLSAYIQEVQGGVETENVLRLKKMLEG